LRDVGREIAVEFEDIHCIFAEIGLEGAPSDLLAIGITDCGTCVYQLGDLERNVGSELV